MGIGNLVPSVWLQASGELSEWGGDRQGQSGAQVGRQVTMGRTADREPTAEQKEQIQPQLVPQWSKATETMS